MDRRKFISTAGYGTLAALSVAKQNRLLALHASQDTNAKSLIDAVKKVCDRLAPHGWKDLFATHGLNITAPDLATELSKELPGINRKLKGFEDFASEGSRAIEPGSPARSLLFHAFASPQVIFKPDNKVFSAFPSLAELEVIENYVFGSKPVSLTELRARFKNTVLAIGVFASEYRNAPDTVHRKNADMCYSRVGVARVGNANPHYDAQRREFLVATPDDVYKIRVLPARYAPYIAIKQKGDVDSFGPSSEPPGELGNEVNEFWVPVHKLFTGHECINGLDLKVSLRAHHVNEKIRRIHLALKSQEFDSGWQEPDISNEPFIFTKGIAEFSTQVEDGVGLLVPTVHPALVEQAKYRGEPLTFKVPPNRAALNMPLGTSTMLLKNQSAPELIHVRRKLDENGQEVDLNTKRDLIEEVKRGNYQAIHYIDFTGDGWIEAVCEGLDTQLPRVSAYSIVAAPNFFANANIRELLEWSKKDRSEPWAMDFGWFPRLPTPLSDVRLPANLKLKGANFDPIDRTSSTIVSLPMSGPMNKRVWSLERIYRQSYLPDAASGTFEPGWEIGADTVSSPSHLASYTLSSPFPEDLKICAALSSYWPGVVPESAHLFEPTPELDDSGVPSRTVTGELRGRNFITIFPLTDLETGQGGGLPWDGVMGPRVALIQDSNSIYVESTRSEYADYVSSALNNRFSLALTSKIDFREYWNRIKVMNRAYIQFNNGCGGGCSSLFRLLSFNRISRPDPELLEAQKSTKAVLDEQDYIYRVVLYKPSDMRESASDFHKVQRKVTYKATMYIDPTRTLYQDEGQAWELRNG